MTLGNNIRAARKALNLTQEQLAQALCVSAPAVSKWELDQACPDMLLLPLLARVLKTDPNALLSFQKDLSAQEIAHFCNELSALGQTDLEAAFAAVFEKTAQFPHCGWLCYLSACTLDGLCSLYDPGGDFRSQRPRLRQLLQEAEESDDPSLRPMAQSALAGFLIEDGELDEARRLVDALPEHAWDKQGMLAKLHSLQGHPKEAARIWEAQILESVTSLLTCLTGLIKNAVEEGRPQDAELYARAGSETAARFGLNSFSRLSILLEAAVFLQDTDRTFSLLEEIVPVLSRPLSVNDSPFFRHLAQNGWREPVFPQMARLLLNEARTSPEYAFLRSHPDFERRMSRLETACRT